MTRRLATIVSALLLMAMLLAPLPATAKGVVLNFSDVDIATMAKFISDLTGKNFVMDDRVKGKISVFSPGKLTPEEAFNLFTSVLELKGFALSFLRANSFSSRLFGDPESSLVGRTGCPTARRRIDDLRRTVPYLFLAESSRVPLDA